ncbi:CTD nuclear envelope phosphatase 1 [Nematocida minor]|uniref:CTD nuclear envelope phosphatase 1 n=1 Tax=Nematocida minor TaxID=1912983 RepID=UPI00222081A8|nr:CTD nuclear envelope phosphatase 1 [Nematocida minor]KAI5188970.1 CTD nuclear envelope phosphatase 1 [Nematocida minor]
MKEEERYNEISYRKKESEWEALVRATCVTKHIKSLDVWNFLDNFQVSLAKKKYLVVGLQGVILYSTITQPEHRVDHLVQYEVEGTTCTHFVTFRPMLQDFFEMVSRWYTIILYTSMEKEFADGVADYLERRGSIFEKRLYRSDCDYLDGKLLKDLEKVSKDPASIVVLDYDFGMHTNILPIDMYTGCPKDRNLLSTILILDSLRFCSDFRSILELAHM